MRYLNIGISILMILLATSAYSQREMTAPLGGEALIAGSQNAIKWDTSLVAGMVTISLWDGNRKNWKPICENVPSEEGGFDWHVPADLNGHLFRLKLTAKSVPSSALTKTFFSIIPPAPKVEAAVPGVTSAIDMTVHPNPATREARICVADLPADIPANVEVVNESGAVGRHAL